MNSYISDVAGGIIVDKGQRTNFTEIQYKVKENIKKCIWQKFKEYDYRTFKVFVVSL